MGSWSAAATLVGLALAAARESSRVEAGVGDGSTSDWATGAEDVDGAEEDEGELVDDATGVEVDGAAGELVDSAAGAGGGVDVSTRILDGEITVESVVGTDELAAGRGTFDITVPVPLATAPDAPTLGSGVDTDTAAADSATEGLLIAAADSATAGEAVTVTTND